MDIDDITGSAETAEEPRVSKRQLVQQAVALAMQSRWQEAADINRQIADLTSDDSETYNRLGKAYRELGQLAESRQAYEQSLRIDPANAIALRSLDQLSRISEAEVAELVKRAGRKLDPRFFMEETGKTGIAVLQNGAAPETVATLTAGDEIALEARDGGLLATTVDGVRLGEIEESLANRLTRLMQTGNQYQAGIVGVDGSTIRIIIRETLQAPQNAGRISFPPKTESLPRPYLRAGLLRTGGDEEDEDDLDVDREEGAEDEDEDASEFGFHEGRLDER